MTQTQVVRTLAERCGTNNKVARSFLDELAKLAITETKKNGVFVIPGLGRLVKANRQDRGEIPGRQGGQGCHRSRREKEIALSS
jgi:nucleoid DNA-binding protein